MASRPVQGTADTLTMHARVLRAPALKMRGRRAFLAVALVAIGAVAARGGVLEAAVIRDRLQHAVLHLCSSTKPQVSLVSRLRALLQARYG